MREMDILMGGFFNMYFKEFSEEEISQIDKYIITLSDNDLYKCFLGEIIWANNISDSLIYKLKIFSKKRGLTDS
jgi:succinate dehydrogenase flavin-adding protein (antitoxin of CptAB toxin-antitoxin module)